MAEENKPAVAQPAMRRVIPSYQTKPALIFAIFQITIGIVILIFGIVNFSIRAFVSAGGSSLLAALGLIVTGAFGIVSSRSREVWAITLYLLFSLVTVVFCVTLMAAGSVGVFREVHRPSQHPSEAREAIDLVCIVLAVLAAMALVGSIVLTSMSLFYGCCKQKSGAKYVADPEVQFKRDGTSGITNGTAVPETTAAGIETPAVLPTT